jgi:hypothetical protein
MKPQVSFQLRTDATVLEENYHRTPTALGHRLVDLLKVATALATLVVVVARRLMVMLAAEAAAAGAPHTGLKESRWRRRSRRTRPRRQPRHWFFTRRLCCPPQNRRNSTQEILHGRRERRLPRLLCSTSQPTSPRKVQTSGDHQVRCEARSSPMAQMLCPLHGKCWLQQ